MKKTQWQPKNKFDTPSKREQLLGAIRIAGLKPSDLAEVGGNDIDIICEAKATEDYAGLVAWVHFGHAAIGFNPAAPTKNIPYAQLTVGGATEDQFNEFVQMVFKNCELIRGQFKC